MELEHLITRSIKSYYKNRLYGPIIYLCFLVALSVIFPFYELFLPKTYHEAEFNLAEMYNEKNLYGKFDLKDLYFTGYTKKWLDNTTGYYYYTMIGGDCVIVLMNPKQCQQGEPTIEEANIKAKVIYKSYAQDSMLTNLSRDLGWNEEGIKATVSSYMLSQPDATNFAAQFLEFAYVATGIFAIVNLILYLMYIAIPVTSPAVRQLIAYGNPKEILDEAEEEIATLPQVATEDMFITEHYFVETSNYGVAIVPIDSIIWIYKYSNLHKLLWHHFAISYRLNITADKRHYIRCPKTIKTDLDGIIDYLAEANHDILVGFTEENRLKVKEIQGDFGFVKDIGRFLNKKI